MKADERILMSTYVLVPGAGGEAWYWSRVVGELTRRGHEAIAVDLPAADESAGLAEYVDVVVAAAEGQDEARRRNDEQEGRSPDGEFDPFTYFLHDVPPDVLAEAWDHDSDQSGRPFEFQRRVSRERLGVTPGVLPGGHLVALSNPVGLVGLLESYQRR